ncbi:hypothetical protein MNEG_4121, partial [Monoraphidium neglectum]
MLLARRGRVARTTAAAAHGTQLPAAAPVCAAGRAPRSTRSGLAVVRFATDSADGEVDVDAAATARFRITTPVRFGEHVRVVGGAPSLGSWSPDAALKLTWSEGDKWEGAAQLPAGQDIEFKFLICPAAGAPAWEPGANHKAALPEGAEAVIVAARWGDAGSTQITPDPRPAAEAAFEAPAAAPAPPPPAAEAAPAPAPAPALAADTPVEDAAEAAALRTEVARLSEEASAAQAAAAAAGADAARWRDAAAGLVTGLRGARLELSEGLDALRAAQPGRAEAQLTKALAGLEGQLARLVAAAEAGGAPLPEEPAPARRPKLTPAPSP